MPYRKETSTNNDHMLHIYYTFTCSIKYDHEFRYVFIDLFY